MLVSLESRVSLWLTMELWCKGKISFDSWRKVRIRTILGFFLCKPRILALRSKSADRTNYFVQTSPTYSGFSPLLCWLCQLADVLPAKEAACHSWFAFTQNILYATQFGVSELKPAQAWRKNAISAIRGFAAQS